MANRTVKDAATVKGTNPQYLIEKIIRTRIYESKFWKEECFALSAELLVDKAMELKYLGGVYAGNVKVSPFLCLILKMLQIQPEKDIIVEFITQPDFKYVRALGALYMRLTGTSLDCYKYLEPLYLDYRKLKRMDRNGLFDLVHMDEYVDDLLREERILDIILPRIQKRHVLEEMNQLEPRVSALMDDGDVDVSDDDVDMKENDHHHHHHHHHKNDSSSNNVSATAYGNSNSSNTNDVINGHRTNNNNNERSRRSRSGSKHRRNSSRSPAHKRRRSHSKERESRREKERDREKERGEKDKERERDKKDREKDREKERDKKDREKDRERERNRHKERRRSRSREKRHRRNDEDDDDGYHKSKRR